MSDALRHAPPSREGIAFTLVATDPATGARAGILHTPHGDVPTPAFMPVGTLGAVKTLAPSDLEEIGAHIILANTYHLFLRPGEELVRDLGGLHRFMAWPRAILTDSGGFQVMSLSRAATRSTTRASSSARISTDRSDSSRRSARCDVQLALGADVIMAFDQCARWPATHDEARAAQRAHARVGGALARTRRRIAGHGERPLRALRHRAGRHVRGPAPRQRASAITRHGLSPATRSAGSRSASRRTAMFETLPLVDRRSSRRSARATSWASASPRICSKAIARGVDMFDCVMPTRNARNGTVFTSRGRLVVKNAAYARDDSPLDPDCACSTCRRFSRAYLRHLFQVGEMLGMRLASLHSLAFYLHLMRRAREAIVAGRYGSFRSETLSLLRDRDV